MTSRVIATIHRTVVFDNVVDARSTLNIVDAVLGEADGFGGATLRDSATGQNIPVKLETYDKSKAVIGGQEATTVSGKYIRIFSRLHPEWAEVVTAGADEAVKGATTVSEDGNGPTVIKFDGLAFMRYLQSLNLTETGTAVTDEQLVAIVVEVVGLYASEDAQSSLQFTLNKARKVR